MKRKLKVADINSKFALTAGELKNWLTETFSETQPVILKCGGKNFRLSKLNKVHDKPVLIGR